MARLINETDDPARDVARALCTDARHGALGTLEPATAHPMVTRVAMLWHGGVALMLISDLSLHAQAMQADPRVSLLLGEPGPKGDPLTHPRMTLQGRGVPTNKAALRRLWLSAHPKSKLYFDFTDFRMMQLVPDIAYLNGGFGKAYQLSSADLPS